MHPHRKGSSAVDILDVLQVHLFDVKRISYGWGSGRGHHHHSSL